MMGVNVTFLLRYIAGTNKLWFGRFAVCRKACFIGHLYTVNSAAAEKTNFSEEHGGKHIYPRSTLWPTRPLKTHTVRQPVDMGS